MERAAEPVVASAGSSGARPAGQPVGGPDPGGLAALISGKLRLRVVE